jgi:hypothetical protein
MEEPNKHELASDSNIGPLTEAPNTDKYPNKDEEGNDYNRIVYPCKNCTDNEN